MRIRLKEKVANVLPAEALSKVYSSFDIIGNIAILKTAGGDTAGAEAFAKHIMATHKKLKAVYAQTSPVKGDFRVRSLGLLAGEKITETSYRESDCIFKVDVEKCYFSPRLSHERARIAAQVQPGETVVNMFAGVGCFSIIIAKSVSQTKVYSIDINPTAFCYMQQNVRLNRVFGKVQPLLGDAKNIIETQLQGVADRVLMPLPELALQYLPTAVSALKASGGKIHYYDFEHAVGGEDPLEKTRQKVAQILDGLSVDYGFVSSRVVRSTGPNWFQTVLDIEVNHF
ncbi:MAG: class I SAM-dependent methyltransferase family protein [Candidatus Bathyarchaeota archaeon]|nr:class I SAM-dependent methyltransferase family protein [Candidatus Bathyarchaeota archaeon]